MHHVLSSGKLALRLIEEVILHACATVALTWLVNASFSSLLTPKSFIGGAKFCPASPLFPVPCNLLAACYRLSTVVCVLLGETKVLYLLFRRLILLNLMLLPSEKFRSGNALLFKQTVQLSAYAVDWVTSCSR